MLNLDKIPHCLCISPSEYYCEGLQIVQLGYHNFQTVKPVYSYWRKQKFYTLHYILNGEGTLKIYGKTYRLRKNHCFFIPPNVPFLYYPSTENPWSYMWFGVNGEFFKNLFDTYNFNSPTQEVQPNLNLENLIEAFFSDSTFFQKTEEEMLAFFCSFMSLLKKEPSVTNSDDAYVKHAKTLIELNYNVCDFSIEQISESFNLFHSRLCFIFKQKTGTTLKNYLMQTRLKFARRLLEESEESVTHISELCGYNCPLYFSNAFKSAFSLSPKKYREQCKLGD